MEQIGERESVSDERPKVRRSKERQKKKDLHDKGRKGINGNHERSGIV